MTIREIYFPFSLYKKDMSEALNGGYVRSLKLKWCLFFEKKIRLIIAGPMGNLFLVSPSLEELCLECLGHFPARWRAYFNGKDLFFLVLTIE